MRFPLARPLIAALLVITAPVIAAAPIRYEIDFGGGSPTPMSGSFTYDSSSMAGFTDFFVKWNGITFDLTSSANSEAFRSESHATRCGAGSVGAAMSFRIMSKSCVEPGAIYEWFGIQFGILDAFTFLAVSPKNLTAPNESSLIQFAFLASGVRDVPLINATGSYQIRLARSVPAPSPALLLPLLAVGLLRRRGRV